MTPTAAVVKHAGVTVCRMLGGPACAISTSKYLQPADAVVEKRAGGLKRMKPVLEKRSSDPLWAESNPVTGEAEQGK